MFVFSDKIFVYCNLILLCIINRFLSIFYRYLFLETRKIKKFYNVTTFYPMHLFFTSSLFIKKITINMNEKKTNKH